jgi:hypothetical protein
MSSVPNIFGRQPNYVQKPGSEFQSGRAALSIVGFFRRPQMSLNSERKSSARQKKRRKTHFDLLTAVHETEYSNVKRPIDPKTKLPIEPAHKFEVTTEGDSISRRK